jgi:hypothetical protein
MNIYYVVGGVSVKVDARRFLFVCHCCCMILLFVVNCILVLPDVGVDFSGPELS